MISLHFAVFFFCKVQKVRDSRLLLSEVNPWSSVHAFDTLGATWLPASSAGAHIFGVILGYGRYYWCHVFCFHPPCQTPLHLMSWIDVSSFQSDLNNFFERSIPSSRARHHLLKAFQLPGQTYSVGNDSGTSILHQEPITTNLSTMWHTMWLTPECESKKKLVIQFAEKTKKPRFQGNAMAALNQIPSVGLIARGGPVRTVASLLITSRESVVLPLLLSLYPSLVFLSTETLAVKSPPLTSTWPSKAPQRSPKRVRLPRPRFTTMSILRMTPHARCPRSDRACRIYSQS